MGSAYWGYGCTRKVWRAAERLTQPQLCILHVQVLFEFFYHDDNDYDFFVFFMQDEKELCLATAQFEDFVLQFMDR